MKWFRSTRAATAAVGIALLSVATATGAPAAEERVSVHYVTNRASVVEADEVVPYGDDRGEVSRGVCEVSFEPMETMSDLAGRVPFYVPTESKTIESVERLSVSGFWPSLAAAAGSAGQVLVYVHGYNFSFDRVCRRAAELQRLLGTGAAVVAFTWPSAANIVLYNRDETNVVWSVPDIRELLCELVDRYGSGNVHLAGHSLGARAVVYSLDGWSCGDGSLPSLGELVLAAADIDAGVFESRLDALLPLVERVTVYASDSDTLLGTSRTLHGYPRLGEGGEDLVVVDGVDTIDTSAVGRFDFSGHNYYYFHPWVLGDLREIVVERRPVVCRTGLEPRERDGRRYWVLHAAESDPGAGSSPASGCELAVTPGVGAMVTHSPG